MSRSSSLFAVFMLGLVTACAAPDDAPGGVDAGAADGDVSTASRTTGAEGVPAPAPPARWSFGDWETLPTPAYPGKQDDIVFVSPDEGFYGNGQGKVFHTEDGGRSWQLVFSRPGTFVRCLGFVDAKTGFLGNVGTDYFPGVTDETPLYRTDDGGRTWAPVEGLDAPGLKGLCAIQVLRWPIIDAGVAGERTLLVAGGRVGGPPWLLLSEDVGTSWRAIDLSEHCGMVLDVRFFTDRIGLVAAASSSDVAESHGLILRTEDGGETWERVYESKRPFELTWKMDFPSRSVGYCTVQSYDPDPASSRRYIARTRDGGRTWRELPLIDDVSVRPFGVGFLDEVTGFVGATPHGFVTRDGGTTWAPTDMGNAVNKIRVLPFDADGDGVAEGARAYAIGVQVQRLDAKRVP